MTAAKEKLVVTGMGAITPIGCGVDKYWDSLIEGRCGVDRISRFDAENLAVKIAAEVRDFDVESYMPRKMIHETDAFTQYAYAAAKEAIGEKLPAAPERTGIVMGTAMAGVATTAETQEILTNAVHKNVGPRFVPRILGNIAAAQIAISYGISGPSSTISTACASGCDAVSMAAMMLRAGEADAVVAVGSESILCPLVIYSLANAHTLSRSNDDPLHACRPFDMERNGFVIGEGGGALVIETESHALGRGAEIYAELAGWANNNDAYHVTDPDPEGKKAAQCIASSIQRAGLAPEDVDYINAHGTGTKLGDSAELAAIGAVFGTPDDSRQEGGTDGSDGTYHAGPAISSTKGATGHVMGGGGLTESIACIKAIGTGVVPPTLNLEEPEGYFNIVAGKSLRRHVDVAINTAFGFGGQNASLVFRRYER
ncbi:beta-ketoacyl-[acyl-carrier-protein] synthase family protein [Gallibacter sp. Marseille-QA0791]|uniref:beta-ketoacyl-[acyl-carrier-protein] synthase family protein n=1 Tax=Gallibacter sp. Marseille-QA0791 TaxID=3378781 RepID=UPI003D0A5437